MQIGTTTLFAVSAKEEPDAEKTFCPLTASSMTLRKAKDKKERTREMAVAAANIANVTMKNFPFKTGTRPLIVR